MAYAITSRVFLSSPVTNLVYQQTLSARNTLRATFGTKKAQKAIKALTENAIASTSNSSLPLDATSSAILESITETSTNVPSQEQLQALVDESKPIPTVNLEAESPAEVYQIEDLMGMDNLVAINVRAWQEAVKKGDDVKTTSLFVSKRLRKTVEKGDVKKMKVLRYILLLLNWNATLKPGQKGVKKLPPKEDLKNALGEELGDGVLESVRRKFAPDM